MCGIFAYIHSKQNTEQDLSIHYRTIQHRGPDQSKFTIALTKQHAVFLGFHRLKIIDMSENSSQPIFCQNCFLICNGEIYNYKHLILKHKLTPSSNGDCEVIVLLYKKLGFVNMLSELKGVFSFVLVDTIENHIFAARDRLGIRPLFYKQTQKHTLFASEAKALRGIEGEINPFLPGHMYIQTSRSILIQPYYFLPNPKEFYSVSDLYTQIRHRLHKSVSMRLQSDRPIGCFLSGGLDSSIICSLLKTTQKDIHTFSIGLKESPDLYYARKVSKYLKTTHHEVQFTFNEAFSKLSELIRLIETYDVTTIRASMPQYLLSKYIQKNTKIRVLFSGEGADELFAGYKYLAYAPNEDELRDELYDLVKKLYKYDVLRTDRTTAGCGLEVRVPFLDSDFVSFAMNITPSEKKVTKERIEKYILRKSFENDLSSEVVWRRKEAFSDAVGLTWVEQLQQKLNVMISDHEFNSNKEKMNVRTKEEYYYKLLYSKNYKDDLIKEYWMPKQEWFSEIVTDPSARVII